MALNLHLDTFLIEQPWSGVYYITTEDSGRLPISWLRSDIVHIIYCRNCNMIHAVVYQRFLTSLCLLFMKTVTYFPFDTKLLLVSSTYIRIYKWSDKSKRCCFRGVYGVHSPWYQNWLHCIIQYFVTSLTKTIFFQYTMFQFQNKKIS